MARALHLLALLGLATASLPARAEEMYAFTDADGVLHVTNVPQDRRYRKVRAPRVEAGEPVHRIVLRGRTAGPAARRAGPSAATAYEEHIRAAAERYGLPTPLLRAVMAVESNFDPGAVSEKGATGLMQLMPGTARDLSVRDLFDPAQNIEGGARYLRQLQDRFGNDLEKTLAAYNAGPEAVRRAGGAVPAIPETREYVKKVLARYDGYLRAAGRSP